MKRLPAPVCANTTLMECRSEFLIRCEIGKDRSAQVFSSVTAHSVIFFEIADYEDDELLASDSPCRLIAFIPLSEPVDPNQSVATLDGDDLVLRLIKRRADKPDDIGTPVEECPTHCSCKPFESGVRADDEKGATPGGALWPDPGTA